MSIENIQNQEAHHNRCSFAEEYVEMLKKCELEYDERYVFKPIE